MPPAAMRGKGDHVFNDSKGFGTARNVGNDREHAGSYKSLPKLADNNMNIIACSNATECLPGSIGSQFRVVRPQLAIEHEDPGKIIRFRAANCRVHVDLAV